MIFSCSLSADLKALKGDEGARQIMKKLGRMVDYLAVQDEAVIFDIDTPEILRLSFDMDNHSLLWGPLWFIIESMSRGIF